MTDHELATLIRQHVSDEPTYGAAPEQVLRRGRQSVRRTRSMVALAGAAVVVLAGALVVPQLRSDGHLHATVWVGDIDGDADGDEHAEGHHHNDREHGIPPRWAGRVPSTVPHRRCRP